MRINPNTAKIRDNKKIRHLFYIIPHFSYEIKIFIVSLQNEEEDKKEKRGGPENKKVVQKREMPFCNLSPAMGISLPERLLTL